jgi:hypothetical protein
MIKVTATGTTNTPLSQVMRHRSRIPNATRSLSRFKPWKSLFWSSLAPKRRIAEAIDLLTDNPRPRGGALLSGLVALAGTKVFLHIGGGSERIVVQSSDPGAARQPVVPADGGGRGWRLLP